jgi:hypothetical protein
VLRQTNFGVSGFGLGAENYLRLRQSRKPKNPQAMPQLKMNSDPGQVRRLC